MILGGARSGKSRRAQRLAGSLGRRRLIVATAEPFDEEMRERIARHRAERDTSWRTLEVPLALPEALARVVGGGGRGYGGDGSVEDSSGSLSGTGDDVDVVLVDCLTLWLSNLMLGEHDVEVAVETLLAVLARPAVPLVLVSNEVGFGLVPETPLGRRFRDAQGWLNQRVADAATRVELVVAGQSLVVRGAPLAEPTEALARAASPVPKR